MTQLQEFIENMPHGKADEFRNRVVAECNITQSYFRNWRNGLVVPSHYHKIINRISNAMFGKSVFQDE